MYLLTVNKISFFILIFLQFIYPLNKNNTVILIGEKTEKVGTKLRSLGDFME